MDSCYFPPEEYELRWQRAELEMEKRGIETAVVWGRTSASCDRAGDILYLTNYFSGTTGQGTDTSTNKARTFCAVLLRRGENPELHVDDPELRPGLVATDRVRNHPDPVASVAAALKERAGPGEVAIAGSDFFPMKQWQRLVDMTPDVAWQVVDDLIRSVRFAKTARELDCFREGADVINPAMDRLMSDLVAGETEAEAAGNAMRELARRGGGYHKIACSHGAFIDYTCTNPLTGYSTRPTKAGDMVRAFIIGPALEGYYFDPGRTGVVGNNPTSDQRELIEGCATIVNELVDAVRPGISFLDFAKHGDRLVSELGSDRGGASAQYPFYGHPNGLYFETPPYLSSVQDHGDAVVQADTMLGIEAFVRHRSVGTAGFEQNVIVTDDGAELLTTTPMITF
ncbi:MAG: aminopeptidase P family protein [Boseongicola sp. SB0662_bin_57]|nr:aminopeptidase P family protein [Boseongicola sp. SB0662_bin_57]